MKNFRFWPKVDWNLKGMAGKGENSNIYFKVMWNPFHHDILYAHTCAFNRQYSINVQKQVVLLSPPIFRLEELST
jgi:hypothetical protein